jgi:hypothetical protein
MNERIKELADEAAKFSAIMALPTGESGDNLFVEKFAQLIVEQCAGIIESQDVDPSFKLRLSWAVKQYFGVES